MARIYIETTVVSFYFNARPEPEMVARQNWTRRWLDGALLTSDELVTSVAVETELNAGDFPHKSDMIRLASRFPLLDINDAVIEAVEAYIANHVMPNDPGGDAFHLAAASFHRCDFLVTWNCRHIANANKFGHIRRVNAILGLGNPALVTPLELLNEETDNG
ncbi:MAG: type II toxin-antitoxin system VapC family toxin [Planctomycetota bacterium]